MEIIIIGRSTNRYYSKTVEQTIWKIPFYQTDHLSPWAYPKTTREHAISSDIIIKPQRKAHMLILYCKRFFFIFFFIQVCYCCELKHYFVLDRYLILFKSNPQEKNKCYYVRSKSTYLLYEIQSYFGN